MPAKFVNPKLFNIETFKQLINSKTKFIAITHISNVLGTILPIKEIINIAKESNCKILIDGAQAIAHQSINIQDLDPDILINLAAYTAVEKAEYNADYARKVNALSLKSFAKTIKEKGGHIIQISTDYVFNGEQNSPYKTSQPRKPLGIYGKTKCEGEIYLENILCNTNQFTIIRTSWLVGPWRSNFVKTILRKLKDSDDKESLKIVFDQVGCITTTESLVKVILLLINMKFHNEILPSHLHWCSAGEASW